MRYQTSAPAQAYKQVEFGSAGRGKLVVMLYEGAIKFLTLAAEALERNDYAQKGLYIGRATDVIGELRSSLNFKDGADIARQLDRIYQYMITRLWRANVDRDQAAVKEVVGLLETLCDAWKQAVQEQLRTPDRSSRPGGGGGLQVTV
ncbi:MAG: flagellar export chaperone FliS [Candidatus Schekmanbacteria bacterium]|nr:flagellar export chaperone FliS [Candidatus Schekmanbacteria bacterium]